MELEEIREKYLRWVETPAYAQRFKEDNRQGIWFYVKLSLIAVLTLVLCFPIGFYFLYMVLFRSKRMIKEERERVRKSQCIPCMIVIANREILSGKAEIAPALVVGSFAPETPGIEDALLDAASVLNDAYGSLGKSLDPRVELARPIMADDTYHKGRRQLLPMEITGGHEIYAFDLMLWARDWGGGPLREPVLYCVAEPGEKGEIRMVPTRFWDSASESKADWAESIPTAGGVSYSGSGNPIIRYDEVAETRLTAGDEALVAAISDHIERHFGAGGTVWHEIISEQVHIDIHLVPPTEDRRFHYLITSGMSELPMNAPEGMEDCRHAELCLALPPEWPLDQASFQDEGNYWPIRWLKILARFPHTFNSWLWWGHSMPNGDPAEPLEGTGFTGFVMLEPQLAPEGFGTLIMPDGREIYFLSPYPVYPEEMQLKLDHGTEELEKRLREAGVSEYVIGSRVNVAG